MYFYLSSPEIKCGECDSTNIARTIPKTPWGQKRLVCIDCGHKEPVRNIKFPGIDSGHTNVYTQQEPKEVTF